MGDAGISVTAAVSLLIFFLLLLRVLLMTVKVRTVSSAEEAFVVRTLESGSECGVCVCVCVCVYVFCLFVCLFVFCLFLLKVDQRLCYSAQN